MSIKSLLNQSLTLYNRSGYGSDGEPTFSSGVATACRFEAKTKRILLPDGSVLTIDAEIWVGPDVTVSTNDKANYDSNDYKVVDIAKVVDETGNTHHQELRLVKWPTE